MNVVMAYFDPSAGSLLLQALCGGLGGIAVIGRYVWMHFFGNQPVHMAMSHSHEIDIPKQFRN